MSESDELRDAGPVASASVNRTAVIALVAVIVVLLAAIVALVYVNSKRIPGPTPGAVAPGGAAQVPVAFDPATATKVPAGMAPADFVRGYYEAVDKGDYAAAYKMLPPDKQQSYGDSAKFEQQLTAYGISGFEVEQPVETDDMVTVVAWQQTPNGSFGYKWTLVKEGEEWVLQSRVQAGMK